MRSRRLLVRKTSSDQWYFSLQDIMGSVVLLWPATMHKVGNKLMWAGPDLSAQPMVFGVADPAQLQAAGFSWSPSVRRVMVGMRREVDAMTRPQLVAKLGGAPRLLLAEAAWNAFGALSSSTLLWCCKQLGFEATAKDNLLTMLTILAQGIIKNITDEQVLEVLAKRKAQTEILSELVSLDAVEELVHKSDRQDFEQEQQRSEKARDARESFKPEWKRRKKALREASRQSKNAGARSAKAKGLFHGQHFPA